MRAHRDNAGHRASESRCLADSCPARGNARRAQAGETIIETLCALTVAGLAGVILVMAIGSASNVVSATSDAAEGYYEADSALADDAVSSANVSSGTAEVTVTSSLSSTQPPSTVKVRYKTYADAPGLGGGDAVSYRAVRPPESGAGS